MTSCITGGRSRAAALRFLFACAFVLHVEKALAQQAYEGDEYGDNSTVIADDVASDAGPGPTNRAYEHAANGAYDHAANGAYDHGANGTYDCSPGNYHGDYCGTCENYPPSAYCGAHEPCCEATHPPGWFGVEGLVWRLDGNELPPLVTDGPATTPLALVARLDDPDTEILAGDESVNDDWRGGYRIFGGVWLGRCHSWGIGADYFKLGDDEDNFTSEPEPDRVVGRPFFNAELGQEDVQFVSIPNELDGTVDVHSNDTFQGAGVTFNHRIWQCCDPCGNGKVSQITFLGGYRYYKYCSDLTITENLLVLPGTTTQLVPGTTFYLQDDFRTCNEFHGGEFGLQGYQSHCWWWVDGMLKVAMGRQSSTVTIDGETFVNVPGGGTFAANGGLLTSELTNIGRYRDSELVFIPEIRLGLGAMLTRSWSFRAGYNVIIWSDVAFAGRQLPPGLEVDPRNLPPVQPGGGEEPEFDDVRGSQLIAHGLDFSVTWQF